MPKTKLTTIEIQSLISFGRELDRRMKQARIGFAELSRLTDGSLSVGYISDIARAGRGDSQKYFRLGREKVAILAKALGWDENEALDFAGFKSVREQADTIEEVLNSALFFDRKGLSEADRETLRPLLGVVDREVDRLTKSPAVPQDDDIRQTYEEFEAEIGGPAVKRIPSNEHVPKVSRPHTRGGEPVKKKAK